MKKLLKCVSIFILMFAVAVGVKASPIDDVIEAGKVTLKFAKPSTEDEVYTMMDYFADIYEGYSLENCNESGTQCDLMIPGNMGPSKKVATINIEFDYDPAIKKVADSFLKKMGEEEKTFYMNDIEAINYFYANHAYVVAHPELADEPGFDGFALTFPSFSSELKKYFEYSNFEVRVGLGDDTPYFQAQGGNIEFWYNGTLYGVGPRTVVVLPYVVYITEDATDVVKAIEDRLGKYFEINTIEKDTTKTVSEILAEEQTGFEEYWDTDVSTWPGQNGYSSKEEYVEDMMKSYDFMKNAVNDRYTVTFKDGWATTLVVLKDDKQAKDTRKVITNDTGTGIVVSTEGLIPLDTLIQVARITSGDEYEKIVKLLKVNDVEMFDLKLYSTSEEKFITKLDSGKFQVKLPIKDEFKDKSLVVYYVDENDKVTEYDVAVSDDGYAVFETDHFSIYTLAVGSATKNPKTGDSILLYVSALMLSSLVLLVKRTRKN